MRLVLGAIAAVALCASAQAADPWATLATRDLDAIHDLLLANHPGPVAGSTRSRNPDRVVERAVAFSEARRGFDGSLHIFCRAAHRERQR
jgi:hypothetical protein